MIAPARSTLLQVISAIIPHPSPGSPSFLVGRRSPHKVSAPGYWCPVSGRIEPGETEIQAVVRECWEEVGLRVEPVRKVAEFPTHDETAIIHWWLTRIVEGEAYLRNDEHTELRWATAAEIAALEPVFAEDAEVFRNLGL